MGLFTILDWLKKNFLKRVKTLLKGNKNLEPLLLIYLQNYGYSRYLILILFRIEKQNFLQVFLMSLWQRLRQKWKLRVLPLKIIF